MRLSLRRYAGTANGDATTLQGVTPSAYGLTLIDDADASTARTTLGLGTMATATETSYLLADGTREVGGKLRIVQSGTAQATVYALSVQSSSTSTWLEILNSGGAGQGAFFGMAGNDFQQWNSQGGAIRFYTAATPSTGTLRLTIANDGNVVIDKNLQTGPITVTQSGTAFNGSVYLGNTAAFQGRISYDGATGADLQIENTYNSADGDIIFRTRTAGTAVVNATMRGTGYLGLTAITSPTAWLHTPASTTAAASLRMPAGTAPTAPNDGDVWKLSDAFVLHATDATTSAVVNTLRLRRNSSGTPAAGFGSALSFQMKSSTTAGQDAGRLIYEWDVATDASRASRGRLTAYSTTTEQEAIRWTAHSGGVKLGFYGVTAVARSATYTPTNVTTDRAYNADSTTLDEVADVLGTLIADLKATGIIG